MYVYFAEIFQQDLDLFSDFFEVHELKTVYYNSKQPLNWAHCSINFFLLILNSRRNFLLVARYSLLFTRYSLPFTRYLLLFTRYFLLGTLWCLFVTRCYLLGTYYILFLQHCIIFNMFTLYYASVPEKENTSPIGCFSLVGWYCLIWCRFDCI